MKIGLYHPWVYLMSGIERMLVQILTRSAHEWTVYTHRFEPESTFPELASFPVVELAPRVSVRRSFGPLTHAARTIARARLPLEAGTRALLVSSEGLGDLILLRNRLPAACYCHTPLKILHDPETRSALGEREPGKAAALAVMGPAWNALDRRLWRRYRRVLVNSHEVLGRVRRARLAGDDRVEILRPGVDLERFTFGDGPREPFFLVAGRIMWQKHIELAIDALRVARGEGLRERLVIAGKVDVKSRPYIAALRERARDLPITFEVDPSDERLADLYRRCRAVVFTPRNEDFGMVPLEAMAAGALVIGTDRGGAQESIRHGETGWLLPSDPAAFAAKMREVAGAGDVGRMRAAGRRRAAEFSWESFVRRLDAVMEEVASEKAGAAERDAQGPRGI